MISIRMNLGLKIFQSLEIKTSKSLPSTSILIKSITFPVGKFNRSPIVSCQAYGLNNNVYVKDVSRTRFIIVNPTDQNLQAAYFVNGVKLEAIVWC